MSCRCVPLIALYFKTVIFRLSIVTYLDDAKQLSWQILGLSYAMYTWILVLFTQVLKTIAPNLLTLKLHSLITSSLLLNRTRNCLVSRFSNNWLTVSPTHVFLYTLTLEGNQ